MAEAQDELLEHEYDGIREYNNPLPNWWLGLFYITIVFAVIYIPYYLLGFGLSSSEAYKQELSEAASMYQGASTAAAAGGGAPAQGGTAMESIKLDMSAAAVAAGKDIFAQNCLPCHGPQGQGVIGPNLTDNYWLHGNRDGDLVNTITNGVPEKGMIAWKAVLNPVKIQQVAAFVRTLAGTSPPNPKEPQGVLVPPGQ